MKIYSLFEKNQYKKWSAEADFQTFTTYKKYDELGVHFVDDSVDDTLFESVKKKHVIVVLLRLLKDLSKRNKFSK